MSFLLYAIAVAAVCTVYVALARTGLLPDKGSPDAVAADAELAGILVAVGAMGWATLVGSRRPGNGVGTVAIEVGRTFAATAAAYLYVVAVMAWVLALGRLLFTQAWVWASKWHMAWVAPVILVAVIAVGVVGGGTFQTAPSGARLVGLACAAVSGVGMAGLVGWFLAPGRKGVGAR